LQADHLIYFLLEVAEQIDLSPIVDDYDSEKGGQPPFHPQMMLVLPQKINGISPQTPVTSAKRT